MEDRKGPRTVRFRRELRLFLAGLSLFLITLILSLIAIGSSMLGRSRRLTVASLACQSLLDLGISTDLQTLRNLDVVRRTHGFSAIEVRQDGRVVRSGPFPPRMEAVTCGDASRRVMIVLVESERGLRFLSLIFLFSLISTLTGVLLLLLFFPRFIRPVTEMLQEAERIRGDSGDEHESRYLVNTFRETVQRLEEHESDLSRFRETGLAGGNDISAISGAIGTNFTSGFIAIDAEGRVVEVNVTGRTILGLGDADAGIIRKPVTSALPASELRDVLARAHRERSTLSRREISASAGQMIGLTTIPVQREGNFIGLLALFTDLTPIRRMEMHLRDTQRLADIGEISAGIAHEVRNSLSTILGYLRLAERSEGEELLDKIHKAQKEAVELASSLESLLRFSRPLPKEFEKVRLRAVLDRLVEQFSVEHPAIDFMMEGADPQVDADPHLLGRAFENLLRNGVEAIQQASRERGLISIALFDAPPRVSIRDNGAGIETGDIERLMLPFQSRKATGFGLGLPLTKKVIVHHNGTFELRGEPGVGSVAEITFDA